MSEKPTITINRKIINNGSSFTVVLPKNWVESRIKESGLTVDEFCDTGANILQFNDHIVIIPSSIKKTLTKLKEIIEHENP